MNVMLARFLFFSLCVTLLACSEKKSVQPVFQLLDSAQTGIGFINRLDENKNGITPLEYLYYYNGAGVAAGDINNDGLIDLFFVSNHQQNKLYLNEGNLKFRDITRSSGIEGHAQWKTGVTLTDINGDGFLDIYICAVSDYKSLKGANELYINNGDNTFTEKSRDYGLDVSGMNTQSAFFDYDHDGDLDMYLLTHNQHIARSYDRVHAGLLTGNTSRDRLFRNDNGKFHDISTEAGLDSTAIGYGLGITIADFNADGWDDVYVTRDFTENDLCYINQRNGTFREEGKSLFDYFSRYARGCDAADLDNDGFEELMTADIRGHNEKLEKSTATDDPWEVFHHKRFLQHHPQFSCNTLQHNEKGQGFAEVAAFAGVEATNWSWSVLLADYNNDGLKDIFTSNGIPKRMNNLAYLEYAHRDSLRYAIDLSDQHIQRALEMMPDGRSANFVFENHGGLHFTDQSNAWGFTAAGYAQGAVYADLDNDGDLEIITNNLNEPASIYQNKTRELHPAVHYLSVQLKGKEKNTQGIGATIYLKTSSGLQLQHAAPTRGYLSAMQVPLHFGLDSIAVVDSLVIRWPDQSIQVLTNVKADQLITIDATQTLSQISLSRISTQSVIQMRELPVDTPFIHHENEFYDFYREPLIPFLLSREGPALATGDVNADGLDDYYVGGARRQPGELFIQQPDGNFKRSPQSCFIDDARFEDIDACWLDVDGDKDMDLYVVSGGNEFYDQMKEQSDRLYINDGNGTFTRRLDALPEMLQNKSCVRPYDVDGDGDLDLFIGGRVLPFHYGKPAASYLLINNGKGQFTDETVLRCPFLKTLGMVTDAQWVDIDQDNDADLIVAGDWMPLTIFLNENGKLQELPYCIDDRSPMKNIQGLWHALAAADFDNDGDMDIIAGNIGWNTSLRKAGNESALQLHTGDFNSDEKHTAVISRKQQDGHYYPIHQYEEMLRQMPSAFQKEFPSPTAYAGADIETIARRCNISWNTPLYVGQFASLYLENTGSEKFIVRALPDEVQRAPVFTFCINDLNDDGHDDILVGGNLTGVSPVQGRYTANHGLILQGDGKGNFIPYGPSQNGFHVKGEVRQIKSLQRKNDRIWLVGQNSDSVKMFIGR